MKKSFIFISLLAVNTAFIVRAQPTYPPVWPIPTSTTFYPSTILCTPATYKLVFYDEFNGVTDKSVPYPGIYHQYDLDVDKWDTCPDATLNISSVTTLTRASRIIPNDGSGHCILNMDKVSIMRMNGNFPVTDTVYLDSGYYQIDTVYDTHFYAGEIGSSGKLGSFNHGCFEASISFPSFMFAHCNFYLPDVNGPIFISGCETYGDPQGFYAPDISKSGNKRMEWSTQMHNAIGPLPHYNYFDNTASPHYPSSGSSYWWSLFNSYHIYKVIWDENEITWYVDGYPRKQVARYYSSTFPYLPAYSCIPGAGTYNESEQFPWKDGWIRMVMQMFVDRDTWPTGSFNLGQMKIDWVRVYQQFPDANPYGTSPHYDLCDRKISLPSPCITGTTSFSVTLTNSAGVPNVTTGNPITPSGLGGWSCSSNLTLIPGSETWTSAKLIKTGSGTTGWIKFSDDNPVCPVVNLPITFATGVPPAPPVVSKIHILLFAGPFLINWYIFNTSTISGISHMWTIHDATLGTLYSVSDSYTFLSTFPGIVTSWTVKATDACALSSYTSGGAFKGEQDPPCYEVHLSDTSLLPDIRKSISSKLQLVTDSAFNENDLCSLVKSTIDSFIGTLSVNANQSVGANNAFTKTEIKYYEQTTIYPNPAFNELNINFSKDYGIGTSIEIRVTNISGKVLRSENIKNINNSTKLNIESLTPSVYVIQIVGLGKNENFKFTKE